MIEEVVSTEFDFDTHKQRAISEYTKVRPLYESFCEKLHDIFERCLDVRNIKYLSIQKRAKTLQRFGEKAATPADEDPNRPKYENPLSDIKDKAGIRIITYLLKTLEEVDQLINEEFEVLEKSDKSEMLEQEDKLGYRSVHYLISLKSSRSILPEYNKFIGLIAEIQVRTILQHAWAEIEHDIEYTTPTVLPSPIKRRFTSLAGLIEIADREFQSIQDENLRIKQEARTSVEEGRLENVEITPDALEAYLDQKLGPDGRMSDFSYEWEAKLLLMFGFKNFKQIDDCIKNYNDDQISNIIWGVRQGQITRFEDMLLAGMGERFITDHPLFKIDPQTFSFSMRRKMEGFDKLKRAGVSIGNYNPQQEI